MYRKSLITFILVVIILEFATFICKSESITNTLAFRYVMADYNDTTDVNFIYVTNDKSTNSPVYSIESKTATSDWELVYLIVYVRHTNYPMIFVYSKGGSKITSVVGKTIKLHETIAEPISYRLKPILD
jgi:hypothetical protein